MTSVEAICITQFCTSLVLIMQIFKLARDVRGEKAPLCLAKFACPQKEDVLFCAQQPFLTNLAALVLP